MRSHFMKVLGNFLAPVFVKFEWVLVTNKSSVICGLS